MIQTVHDKIINYTGSGNIPCVVVGQKSDLTTTARLANLLSKLLAHSPSRLDVSSVHPRQVPLQEGQKLAQSIGSAFLETSARQNSNVCKYPSFLFHELCADIAPHLAKVFDVMLGEIEKSSSPSPPEGSKCVIM